MTEHNATSLSASLVNRQVYTVCYTGLDTLSSFHDALYEARRSYFGSGKTVHIRARGIFDGLSGEVHGKALPPHYKMEKTRRQKYARSRIHKRRSARHRVL